MASCGNQATRTIHNVHVDANVQVEKAPDGSLAKVKKEVHTQATRVRLTAVEEFAARRSRTDPV